MDQITTTIIAALSAGAAGIATEITEVGKRAVSDAYNALKEAIRKKFGSDSKVVKAVEEIESEPDFEPNQTALEGRIKQVRADEDKDLLKLVEELKAALEGTPEGKEAVSKYNLNIQTSEVGNIGDNARITGGIHFGGKK